MSGLLEPDSGALRLPTIGRMVSVHEASSWLAGRHYLGPTKTARFAWADRHGVIVMGSPRSRRIPGDWLELIRWCILDGKGSEQWAAFIGWARMTNPQATTIVSYSDPSVGHDGALYRACNWLWAPTWHRLREPPSGNGAWASGKRQAAKDRWVFPLAPDSDRQKLLAINDEALARAMPWASYREPKWRRGRFTPSSGGGDFKRWKSIGAEQRNAA